MKVLVQSAINRIISIIVIQYGIFLIIPFNKGCIRYINIMLAIDHTNVISSDI